MATTYDKIATTTLGSASTITFSSIASSWTDLRLVLVNKDAAYANNDVYFQFNGDTATNYSYTTLVGDGASASSGRATSTADGIKAGANGNTEWSLTEIDVFSYASSTYKTALVNGSRDKNGSGTVQRIVGLWRSTSAITSIKLLSGTGNFATGTIATLYGILKA